MVPSFGSETPGAGWPNANEGLGSEAHAKGQEVLGVAELLVPVNTNFNLTSFVFVPYLVCT